jgi:replicative DNA helicase
MRAETAMATPTADVCNDEIDRMITEEATGDDIPTSFRAFAEHVGEYKRGQITLVGAPPGFGKTAWAMQEIQSALTAGFVVDAFLMESSKAQFSERWVMRNGAVTGGKFKRKSYTQDDFKAISDCMAMLNKFENQFYMAPMENYTVAAIDALIQARKTNTGQPCDFIVIDHLDCLSVKREKGQGQYEAMKDAVLQLRGMAARENAAMLLMGQLNVDAVKNTVGQANKFPTLDAFRGGTPVEAAKVVVILNKDKQVMLDGSPVVEQQIVICKANDGNTGYIRSLFLKPFAMHIEDVGNNRQHYAKWLNALKFDMNYQRKDMRRNDKANA